MSTYAIGDVHGCFATLEALLAEISFDSERDQLWFVGDLVNKGPRSLDVLRCVRDLGDRARVTLGNHDVHLIGRALGVRPHLQHDRFDEVLAAPDCSELVDWLRQQPVLVEATVGDSAYAMVHAGLRATWTMQEARQLAREVEAQLRGNGCEALLRDYYDQPNAALQAALRVFVHMRACAADGAACKFTGPPEDVPDGYLPWYDRFSDEGWGGTVVFGHWAALGFRRMDRAIGLDSGCAYGRTLTALRLDDGAVTGVALQDVVEGLEG